MKKIIVLIIIMTAVAAGAYFLFFAGKKNNGIKDGFTIRHSKAEEGTITLSVPITGIIKAKREVEVKSKANGQITSFPFEEGDLVREGQLLVVLDPSDEQYNVRTQKASLESVRARLSQVTANYELSKTEIMTEIENAKRTVSSAEAEKNAAEIKLKGIKELYDQKLTSEEEHKSAFAVFVSAESRYKQALNNFELSKQRSSALEIKKDADVQELNAEIEKISISVEQAQERFDNTKIYAPITGILTGKKVEEGQIISSGLTSVSGGSPVCILADVSDIYIEGDVDETDVGAISVRPDLPCNITVDAYPDRKFSGVLERIAPKGIEESNVVVFKVRIKVKEENKFLLRPGMTANVDIVIEPEKSALLVPSESLYEKKKQFYVKIERAGQITEIPVKVGINNGTFAEILDGLKSGDAVVTEVPDKDGQGGFGSRR